MSADYVPQVDDRVRRYDWTNGNHMDVDYVGRTIIAGTDRFGNEWSTGLDGDWIKVETPTPLPERWANVYPDGIWQDHKSARSANTNATHKNRLAILHIWTDANGVDHADIERVSR